MKKQCLRAEHQTHDRRPLTHKKSRARKAAQKLHNNSAPVCASSAGKRVSLKWFPSWQSEVLVNKLCVIWDMADPGRFGATSHLGSSEDMKFQFDGDGGIVLDMFASTRTKRIKELGAGLRLLLGDKLVTASYRGGPDESKNY